MRASPYFQRGVGVRRFVFLTAFSYSFQRDMSISGLGNIAFYQFSLTRKLCRQSTIYRRSALCKQYDNTRKGGNYEALQLEGRTTSCQSFWAVLTKFVLRMPIYCCFRASDENSDTAGGFSDSLWYGYFGDLWIFTFI